MKRWMFGAALAAASGLAGFSAGALAQSAPVPPVAAQKPHVVKGPVDRNDPYYWLRDDTRKNPEMLAYLNAENAYADAVLAPTKPLQDKLYSEFIGRIKQDDSYRPVRERGYFYYTRFETGQDYPIVARKLGSLKAKEQVMLDEPAMAKGHGFFSVGDRAVSQNNRLLAYALDTVGRRQYTLKVKDLTTGQTLADDVANVEPNLAWADDNRTIYYVEKDPVTLLSKRVKAHVLGTPAASDKLVYEEKDDSFYMGVGRTSDDKFICICLQSTVSNEQRCTSAAEPGRMVACWHRASASSATKPTMSATAGSSAPTAEGAKNYKLVELADADAARGRAAWRDLVPHNADVFIENFQPFDSFVAIEERAGGNKRIRLLSNSGREQRRRVGRACLRDGASATIAKSSATKLRYTYDSLTTPEITYEVDASTGARTVLKRTPAPNYDPSQYVTERVWATARDGTQDPGLAGLPQGLQARRHRGDAAIWLWQLRPLDGPGLVADRPEPARPRHGLCDRAYPRRAGNGPRLVRRTGICSTRRTPSPTSSTSPATSSQTAMRPRTGSRRSGGSAGGLLMGAIANMAPQDYRVIIAQVPFVDVVTTMLDASIPLTTNEYDEWGNPAERQYYDYMLSYSPYDNVSAPGLSGDVRRHRPVGQPGPILRAGQIGREAAGDARPTPIRWCSGSTWRPATAASRAGSSNIARAPNITPSCCGSWGLPSRPLEHQHRPLPRAAENGAEAELFVGCGHRLGLRVEQAGEHDRSAGRERLGEIAARARPAAPRECWR